MKQIHFRFYFGLTEKILTINEEQMKDDLEFFHDCNTKPEEFYTADVLSLLKSSNADDVEKANQMIWVRTDNDFYFQCHIIAYLYDIKIRYLGVQASNNDIYFDSIIVTNDMPEIYSSENPYFPNSEITITFLTYKPLPPMDEYLHTIPTKKSLVIPNFLNLENHPEVQKRRVITSIPKKIPNINKFSILKHTMIFN